MQEKYRSEVKRKALRVVAVCALILLILVLSRYSENKNAARFDTSERRTAYLSSIGLETVKGSEEFHSVTIPDELDDTLEKYNELQLEQGFDLGKYTGKTCDQYTYELQSYKNHEEKVYVTIYICDGRIIAGDIHSAEVNGFMAPLSD